MFLPKLENNAWSTLAIESVLIVLSIVLGFLVTEWRQSSENAALAQTARESILSEIEANYRRVRSAHNYHRALRDTLNALDDPTASALSRIVQQGVEGRSGIASPADVLSTAWEAAQSTGAIRHMAWTDVNVLAQAYAKQRVYRRHSDWLGQAIFQTSLERSMGSIFERSRLLPILGQFAAQERQLLARYRQVLRRFGRSIPTDTATTR